MAWHLGVAYFFGGVFTANACPHLIAGVSGKPLQTPFASPPFRGLSPAWVNVCWGLFNVAVAYLLLIQVGEFDVRNLHQFALFFVGFLAMALQCARAFTKLRKTTPQ